MDWRTPPVVALAMTLRVSKSTGEGKELPPESPTPALSRGWNELSATDLRTGPLLTVARPGSEDKPVTDPRSAEPGKAW